jgi:hypothetical protein
MVAGDTENDTSISIETQLSHTETIAEIKFVGTLIRA